jgi:hypothetical protein
MTTASRSLEPLLGLGGVVLLIVGNGVSNAGGGSPDLHASAAEYADAVGRPGTGLTGVYLVVVGLLALAGFFRVLGERLRGTPDGDRAARTVSGGGMMAAAVAVVGGLPLIANTMMAQDGDLDPALAKALQLMNDAVFGLSWLLFAVPLTTAAAAAMRQGALGRVLGWSGVALGGALAVGSFVVWWVNGLVMVWLLALIWIAAASITLAIRARPPASGGSVSAGRRSDRMSSPAGLIPQGR